jgi:ribonuclease P/MRP protein subunit RPP40
VPQGSILGPLLFVIFTNDIDEAVTLVCIIKKFADDTKIGQRIVTEQDKKDMQQALDNLSRWAERWGMEFNLLKCKVMHLGHNNPQHDYLMDGQRLEHTTEENDIGVTVSNTLKPSAQCARAARTTQSVLGQITRAFHYRGHHIFMRLYQQYIRPHLEFSTPVWSPWTVADIDCLERVQKRAVKMVKGLRETEYSMRLKELGLATLE